MAERKKAAAAEVTDKPKFMVVTNHTANIQIITPDDLQESREHDGREIVLEPYASVGVRDYDFWLSDNNLARRTADGAVSYTFAETRPRALPKMPSNVSGLTDLQDRNVVQEIVFGTDDRARTLIKMPVERESAERSTPDNDYLKQQHVPILLAAKAWLKNWGPPEDFVYRVGLIEARLAEIRALP